MIKSHIYVDKDVCQVCKGDIERTYNSYPVGPSDQCLNKNCGFWCCGLTNQFLIGEKYMEYLNSKKPVRY